MKKAIVISFLLIFLITSTGVISAHHNRLPGNTWTSGQQIQNVGQNSTNVQMIAYNPFGDPFDCMLVQNLAPGKSFTFLSEDQCAAMPEGSLPEGFHGSGVVKADQPLAAIVNVNNSPFGPAAEQYVGTSVQDVSTSIVFPLVKNDHAGRTTTFMVQNTSANWNNITAVFNFDGNTYDVDINNIPPKSMVIIDPNDAENVPIGNGAVGSLTVTGSQTLAGVSLEHETFPSGESLNLQASRAFVPNDYDKKLYCPLARYKFGPLEATSGLQVMNVSGHTETIKVIYEVTYPSPHTVGPFMETVGNGESANFLASDHLAIGELAAITVTSVGDGNLAAIVNDRADAPNPKRLTTYACFAATNATNTINLPLVKEDFNNNTTGIQIQNVGTAPAIFTLTYKTSAGDTVVITHSDAVAVGASKTFYRVASNGTLNITVVPPSDINDLPGTVSGVTVTSSQPIIAIANESNYTGINVQDTKNYEGFNQ